MKNKVKKLFRLGFALIAISLLFTNCEKENTQEQIQAETQEPALILKRYSRKDIEKNTKLTSRLKKFNDKLIENKSAKTSAKTVYNSDYDFTIYTDAATYIENGDYHSYTFPLVQDADEKMSNVLFELNDQGEYDAYLVRYDYSANEFNTLDLNTLSLVTSMEPIDLNFDSIFAKTYAYYRCFYFYNGSCCNNYVPGLGCGELTGTGYQNYGCDWILSAEYCELVNSEVADGTTYNNNTATVTIGGINYGGTGGSQTSPTPSPYDAEELIKINAVKAELNLSHPERLWVDQHGGIAVQLHDNYLVAKMWSNEAIAFANEIIDLYITNPNLNTFLLNDWFLNTPDFTEPNLNINPENITYEDVLTQQNLPSLDDFVDNFPKQGNNGNYYEMPTSQVYQLVGGSLLTSHQNNPSAYSNACSIRGSRGLLYSGIDIPVLNYPGVGQRTQKGGDNNNYILDAVSFDKYMQDKFGPATHQLTGADANDPVQVANLLDGKNGIYVIINSSHSQAGYSGHVDGIIDGNCISSAYTTPNGGVKSIRIWVLN